NNQVEGGKAHAESAKDPVERVRQPAARALEFDGPGLNRYIDIVAWSGHAWRPATIVHERRFWSTRRSPLSSGNGGRPGTCPDRPPVGKACPTSGSSGSRCPFP